MRINLLPENEKKYVRKLYRKRRLVISLWFVIIAFAAATVMLIPLYLLSENIQVIAEQQVTRLTQDQEVTPEEVEQRVFELNRKVRSLTEQEHTRLFPLFNDLSQTASQDVRIRAMQYIVSEEGTRIQMSGVANTREALLQLRRDLEQKEYSQGVELPISNFAERQDIDFSITITLEIYETEE